MNNPFRYNPYTNLGGPKYNSLEELYGIADKSDSNIYRKNTISSPMSQLPVDGSSVTPSQGIMGGLGFATSIYDSFKDSSIDNTNHSSVDSDNPNLDSGSYYDNINSNTDKRATREGNQDILKSGASGAALGGMILPGLGHLAGGAVGSIVGAFGKRKRRRDFDEKRLEARGKYKDHISLYNEAKTSSLLDKSYKEKMYSNLYGNQFPTSTYNLI